MPIKRQKLLWERHALFTIEPLCAFIEAEPEADSQSTVGLQPWLHRAGIRLQGSLDNELKVEIHGLSHPRTNVQIYLELERWLSGWSTDCSCRGLEGG